MLRFPVISLLQLNEPGSRAELSDEESSEGPAAPTKGKKKRKSRKRKRGTEEKSEDGEEQVPQEDILAGEEIADLGADESPLPDEETSKDLDQERYQQPKTKKKAKKRESSAGEC